MARKGNNIYKRKDGRWEGRYVKGRKNSRTIFGYIYGHSYAETKAKLAQARVVWEESLKKKESEKKCLDSVSKLWLEERRAFVKESTFVKYQDYLNRYILPEFGNQMMDAIEDTAIEAFSSRLLKEGGKKGQGLSPKTVSEICQIMKYIRKYALKHHIAVAYSADCVTIHVSKKPIEVLSPAEQEVLEEEVCDNPTSVLLGIFLALYTGIRIGELCALKWDDFSWAEQELHIQKTLQRIPDTSNEGHTKIDINSAKTDASQRTIPLSDEVVKKLREHCKPGAYFLTGDENRYMEPRLMEYHFAKILHRCGLRKVNFHVLRHTFATRCVEKEFDIKCLSAILGHSSIAITMDRYVHPTKQMKKDNIEKLFSEKDFQKKAA